MARNGTGGYSLPAPAPFQNGQTADATGMMTVLSDLATAMTASTANDGQTKITGSWNWQTYNISNIGTVSGAAGAFTDASTSNGMTVGNGLTVTKGGAAITGNSTITGTVTVTSTIGAAAGTKAGLAVIYDQFPATLATPGTITLPTGLIIKWGTGSTTLGIGNVTLAAAFPTACLNVQLTINGGAGPSTLNPLFTATVNAAGFDVRGDIGQSLTFYWLAMGY